MLVKMLIEGARLSLAGCFMYSFCMYLWVRVIFLESGGKFGVGGIVCRKGSERCKSTILHVGVLQAHLWQMDDDDGIGYIRPSRPQPLNISVVSASDLPRVDRSVGSSAGTRTRLEERRCG